MDDDLEVPFKALLEHQLPEVYEYIKNAVRMLQRQQNLLAKIKNNSSNDFKVLCLIWYDYYSVAYSNTIINALLIC